MSLKCVCPECKNDIDMNQYREAKVGNVIECAMCGMTLEIVDIGKNGEVKVDIVDEGK
jgi:Zn ribbon nucleic-acid-binding protein